MKDGFIRRVAEDEILFRCHLKYLSEILVQESRPPDEFSRFLREISHLEMLVSSVRHVEVSSRVLPYHARICQLVHGEV